jgi:hypothetical protein
MKNNQIIKEDIQSSIPANVQVTKNNLSIKLNGFKSINPFQMQHVDHLIFGCLINTMTGHLTGASLI